MQTQNQHNHKEAMHAFAISEKEERFCILPLQLQEGKGLTIYNFTEKTMQKLIFNTSFLKKLQTFLTDFGKRHEDVFHYVFSAQKKGPSEVIFFYIIMTEEETSELNEKVKKEDTDAESKSNAIQDSNE